MDLTSGQLGAAVLIADDEEAVCFTLARAVHRCGLFALVASDGMRTLELARTYPSSIVAAVLDLRMPKADGDTVVAGLNSVRPDCPIVVMSAHHTALMEVRQWAGVRAVLEKPFELCAFTNCLASFLGEGILRAG